MPLNLSWMAFWEASSAPPLNSIGIALSGGIDSTALLHWAKHQAPANTALHAYHVHHGLQAHADQWVEHCQHLCNDLNIPLTIHYLDPETRRAAESVEAWAREARYAWLRTCPVECVLLGHHQADQAETLLLQLFRGAGVAGLAAMSRLWQAHQKWWGRPFLNLSKNQLLDYAQQHQLTWIEDPSNNDPQYTRNWLRHTVMPLLRDRHPHIESTLARSAAHCAETWSFVQSMVEEDCKLCSMHLDVLKLAPLRTLPAFRQKHVVRAFISRWAGKPPSTQQLQQALTAFLEPRDPERHRPQIQCAGVCFSLWKDQVWAHSPQVKWEKTYYSIEAPGTYHLPGGILSIVAPTPQLPNLRAVARQEGQSIQIPGDTHPRLLKQLWYQAGISRWDRANFPLLLDSQDHPVWAPLHPQIDTSFDTVAQPSIYFGSGSLLTDQSNLRISWHPQRPKIITTL